MLNQIKYLKTYLVLAALLPFSSALALEVKVTTGDIFVRTPISLKLPNASQSETVMSNFVRDEKRGGVTQLTKGTVLEIPDQYIQYQADGKVDLIKTLEKWKEAEHETDKASRPISAKMVDATEVVSNEKLTFFPVKIKKPGEGAIYFENKQNYVALAELAKRGDLAVIPPRSQDRTADVKPGEKPDVKPGDIVTHERKGEAARLKVTPETEKPDPLKVAKEATATKGQTLRCETSDKPNENACAGVSSKLAKVDADHFVKIRDVKKRMQAFVDYMKPVAQYYQAMTGLPASVIISQAAIETGYGQSYLFRRKNALFGHSCWRNGMVLNASFTVNGTTHSAKGVCGTKRPAAEGGRYFDFQTREESVIAYVHNVMYHEKNKAYEGIRRDIAAAREKNPEGIADWNKIVNGHKHSIGLARYAAARNYRQAVSAIIRRSDLAKLDQNVCQTCLIASGQKRSDSTRVAAGDAPKPRVGAQ